MIQKGLVLVVFCAVIVAERVKIPADLQKQIDELHEQCIQKESLTEEKFKAFDISKKTPDMMCYLKCILTGFKWMNDDEVVQYDFIKKNIHESIKDYTLPHLDNCGKKAVGEEQCEKSYNFIYCMNQAEPENWVIV